MVQQVEDRRSAVLKQACLCAIPLLNQHCSHHHCYRILRDPMVKQVEDRRSAVSKQACLTLGALSDLYGLRFENLVLHYLPVLLRIVPITVQVRANPKPNWGCCLHMCVSVRVLLRVTAALP